MLNYNLYHYCRRNYTEKIIETLKEGKDINVLYQEGIFFRFAIKDNNLETCSALLTYFEQKQFPNKDDKYLEARDQLQEVLENAICEREISKEMKQVLSPYLNFEDEVDSRLQEFSEEENSKYQSWVSSLETNSDVFNNPTLESTGETELSGDLVQDPDLV